MRKKNTKIYCLVLLFQSISLNVLATQVTPSRISHKVIMSKTSLIDKALEKEIRKHINSIDFDRIRIGTSSDFLANELDELDELAVSLLKIRAQEELFTHGNRWDTHRVNA